MTTVQKIVPCLWFDDQAEEAAKFYVSVFEKDSRITRISRYTEEGKEVHGRDAGSVLTVEFQLEGCGLTALNGGPQFRFSEAISLQAICDSQQELDYLWEKLSAGGDPKSEQCGWLKDKFGLSWQIVPSNLPGLIADPDIEKAGRTMRAMLGMKKLDMDALQRAHDGG